MEERHTIYIMRTFAKIGYLSLIFVEEILLFIKFIEIDFYIYLNF